jgi:hypothetical protein
MLPAGSMYMVGKLLTTQQFASWELFKQHCGTSCPPLPSWLRGRSPMLAAPFHPRSAFQQGRCHPTPNSGQRWLQAQGAFRPLYGSSAAARWRASWTRGWPHLKPPSPRRPKHPPLSFQSLFPPPPSLLADAADAAATPEPPCTGSRPAPLGTSLGHIPAARWGAAAAAICAGRGSAVRRWSSRPQRPTEPAQSAHSTTRPLGPAGPRACWATRAVQGRSSVACANEAAAAAAQLRGWV